MSQESDRAEVEPRPTSKPSSQEKTKPMAAYESSEAGGPLDEVDAGPPPQPVDDIQAVLLEAAQQGAPTEIPFDTLPEPVPEVDEGPRPGPVDDIQGALLEAAQQGAPTEVSFDELPEPGSTAPQKVIRVARKPVTPAEPPPDTAPLSPATEVEAPPAPAPLPLGTSIGVDFWLLLAVFVVFRLLTLFLLRPGGFIRDWSDFNTYLGITGLADYGLYPFFHFWLEWPPLMPWLMVGVYKLSLLLPPWPDDPRLWFVVMLGLVFVLFEAGNFVLIYRLARRLSLSPDAIRRVLWLYAGLFPPVYAMLGFFDGVALFFILLALEWLLADRRLLSAVAIGMGFMVKIIPILALPVALRWLWFHYRRNRSELGTEMGLYGVVAGLTIVLLLAPFIIAPRLNDSPQWWVTSFRSMLGRSAWETVWAVADGYSGFGEVGGDRFNPNETDFAVHTGVFPDWFWGLVALTFAAIYAVVFAWPANYSRPRAVIAFGGLTVTLFMLYNKGYSPQFLVYLLPFILLLLPNGRGLTYALILTGLNVLEQPVYFVLLPRAAWLLTFIVVARFVLLMILALEFALAIWADGREPAFMLKLQRYTPLALGSLSAVLLLAWSWRGVEAVPGRRLALGR